MNLRTHLAWALLALLTACAVPTAPGTREEVLAWQRQAADVTIVRDDWGIAHVHGKTDADAVFGVLYAQAEDDFPRVETNYLNALGWLAAAEGESALYKDLRMRLFIDPVDLKAMYAASPPWLQRLMNAYADGLNYYLHTHPDVKPRVITRFEPWMALAFSEGSIGGDIETISLAGLAEFYGKQPRTASAVVEPPRDTEPRGSNGIAIAPAATKGGRSLLLINPHTSFFFRAEMQMSSDEGLNAYGALTWGQFFVYQGFNASVGWMHTSSSVDNIDEYLETIVAKGEELTYRHGDAERPVEKKTIRIPYKTASGMEHREFTVYRTHHGPVVRTQGDKWISVRLMEEPMKALMQSYSRTKARDYAAFRATMDLHTNSSNNTIYADKDGVIAYLHANFVPTRQDRFDWQKPVDGSDPATEWGPLLTVEQSPFVRSPACGWVFNTNNWPYSAAGADSPKRSAFPAYVDRGEENPRGLLAMRVLGERRDFTLDSLLEAAFDSYLPAFAEMIPSLLQDYDGLGNDEPLRAQLAEPVEVLRKWDFRWSTDSVATSLAVFYGEELGRRGASGARPERRPAALSAAVQKLTADFGTWRTPWGDINRFQRLTGDIVHPFDDAGASVPVGFTSARWGSLASFGARAYPQTKKWYGTSGNSFVAVVEFGDRVRARAVSAGGQSGDPTSPHFNDQAQRYATGNLRDVYFYPEDLEGHVERRYRPGTR